MADFETAQHRIKAIDFSANRLGGGTTVLNIRTETEADRSAEHAFFMWNDHEPVITLDNQASSDKGLAAKLLGIVDPQTTYEEGYAMGKEDASPSAKATALAIKQATNVLREALSDALSKLTLVEDDRNKHQLVLTVISCPMWSTGHSVLRAMECDDVDLWLVDNLDLCATYDAIVSGSFRINQARNPAGAWEILAAILAAILAE